MYETFILFAVICKCTKKFIPLFPLACAKKICNGEQIINNLPYYVTIIISI